MRRVVPVLLVLALASAAHGQDVTKEARALLDEDRSREALTLIEKAISQKPNDPDLLALRGEARLDLGRSRDAKADLERAAKADAAHREKLAGIRARIEFLYGNDTVAKKLLEDAPEDDDDKATLPLLMRGPFADDLADIAAVATGRSPGGHYLIYSDVGLTDDLQAKARAALSSHELLPPTPGVKEGGKLLETIYKAYEQVFPFEKDAKLLHRVYIFSKREDFLEFAKSIGEDMEGADGFYRPDTRILAIDGEDAPDPGETFSENTRDTIFHEGFHQFVRFHAPGLPTWLDEGLAEYFGPSKILPGGKLEIGVVKHHAKNGSSTRLEDIRDYLKSGEALSLDKFFAISDEDFAKDDVSARNYAQAWSLIHFLVSTPKRRPLVVEFFKAIRAGKTRETAFAETFGKTDLGELEREWKKYVENL